MAPSASRARPLRNHLITLVAVAVLPVTVFAMVIVFLDWRYQRDTLRDQAQETLTATAIAIDRELDSTTSALKALAVSRALTASDFKAFYEEAQAVRATQRGWRAVVLLGPGGAHLLNLGAAFGTVLPSSTDRPHIEAVFRGEVAVSDLFTSRVTGHPTVDVAIPVVRDGVVKYALVASLDPARFDDLLQGPLVLEGGIGSLWDRNYKFIGRSRDGAKFLGHPPIHTLMPAIQASPHAGVARTKVYDGPDTYSSWRRMSNGWTVAIGIPAAPVDTALVRSLALAAGSGLLVLGAGIAAALVIARRIAGSIKVAELAGQNLAVGAPVQPGTSTVREVESLMKTMATASEMLAKAEDDRTALLERERRARGYAEAASRTKDDFLAVLSHELRTPINAIFGWARMLDTGMVPDPKKGEAIKVILRNANAQVQLIDDLLDLARIQSGKLRLDVRSVDLSGVVEAALDTVRPAADAKDVRLQSILDPGAGPIAGDPARLQQVVWNLLHNAVKFTPRGGRVQVQLRRINSHIEVVISDTGQGIAADVLPVIFDRFQQGDTGSTREHGGLGLGLALVRHLVEAHGGTVSAQSAGVGQGATFVVKLPVALARLDEDGAPQVHPAAEQPLAAFGATVRLDARRVLVVDDDPDAVLLAGAILSAAGADVRQASSAASALEVFTDWRPDIVIADIEMPGEDGLSLVRRMRSAETAWGGKTPAIALSAYARTEDRMRSLTAGFSMHVTKPVEPAELIAIVASLASR